MKNVILSNRKKKVFWDIVFVLGCELSAALCAFITNNIPLTLIYIMLTAVFSICATSFTKKKLEKIIKKFMNMNRTAVYSIFIVIAFSPLIFGVITNEIFFSDIKEFIKEICKNPLPNLFGALIVCSLISHLSKFNSDETILTVIKSKQEFFDIFMRFSFMGAFLNCINYNVDDHLYIVNAFNRLHLFAVVFTGSVLLSVFAIRLIDKRPFQNTAIEIYPTWTLLFTILYLVSCGFSPIILKNTKQEVLLLLFNTMTALCIVWFFSYIIHNKTAKTSGYYQYAAPLMFSFFAIINLVCNLLSDGYETDVKMQILSGSCIMVFVLFLLLYVNRKRKT